MNRVEYMKELEALLADIPADEREDAINYYNDYFDEGGEENEEATIEALGDVHKLAASIKLANKEDYVSDGEFTETGYHDLNEEGSRKMDDYGEVAVTERRHRNSGFTPATLIIIALLAICALPILGPILLGILGVLIGIIATVAGVLIAIFAIGVAGIVAGVLTLLAGISGIITYPMGAVFTIGAAFLSISIGMLIIVAMVKLIKFIIPPIIRAIVAAVKLPVKWLRRLGDWVTAKREERQ
ncbi:MAG: DUF1700 domain-containing protein [Lachnospiraceae bacterium]|nr:DUF1700 domain-containing protein [Lachnospiraceae bacterium]